MREEIDGIGGIFDSIGGSLDSFDDLLDGSDRSLGQVEHSLDLNTFLPIIGVLVVIFWKKIF